MIKVLENTMDLSPIFEIKNMWLSTLYCAIIVIIFFLVMWGKKKIFKNNNKKIIAAIDIILNLIITTTFVILILISLGFNTTEFFNQYGGVSKFLEENTWRIVSILLLVIISSIIYNSLIAIFHVTRTKYMAEKRKRTMDKVIASIFKYIIVIIDAIVILYLCGFNIIPALTGLGIAGLVIGLGAQKLISDFISGAFIIFEHHFDVGDIIQVGDFKGEVIDIGLKTTKIRNWQGDVKIMPNGDVINIVNCSLENTTFSVEFDIAYKEDADSVINLINEELPRRMADIKDLIKTPTCGGISALKDSGVSLIVFATSLPETQYAVKRRMNVEIKNILDEHNIEIPFPQIVVHDANGEKND